MPRVVMVPEAPFVTLTGSIRADMASALAEWLTRALAAGDRKVARIVVAALSALMDDAP